MSDDDAADRRAGRLPVACHDGGEERSTPIHPLLEWPD
jgi:hypothetical protein